MVTRCWTVGLLVLVLGASACGADDSLALANASQSQHPMRRLPWRNCTQAPFTPAPARGFAGWFNRMKTQVAPRHSTQDVIALPGSDVSIHHTFAYGLIGWRLASEAVDMYSHDCNDWQSLGAQQTSVLGDIDIPFASAGLEVGQYSVLSNVLGDASVMESSVRLLPPKTRFVVLDIDGTITKRSNDMVRNVAVDMYWPIASHDYVPEARTAAAEMTHKWHQKGYLIMYLTGRPKLLRDDTMQWLKDFGFAPGTLHMTEHRMELLPRVFGVGIYKAKYLESLYEMGYEFDYAYGDATTDLYAFKRAGIARDHTFYLGSELMSDGAVMINSGDYTDHIRDMDSFPDAEQPFDLHGVDIPE